jgi:hypothetical protein
MPAFTFEKISPPARPAPVAKAATTVVVRKHRGLIVTMLDRFVEARVKRTLHQEKGVIARREPKRRD